MKTLNAVQFSFLSREKRLKFETSNATKMANIVSDESRYRRQERGRYRVGRFCSPLDSFAISSVELEGFAILDDSGN